MDKIPKNHADLKGSFVSIGCRYNLFNMESMEEFEAMLKGLGRRDLKTAREEHRQAIIAAGRWQREPHLWWLYDEANRQGDWSVKF